MQDLTTDFLLKKKKKKESKKARVNVYSSLPKLQASQFFSAISKVQLLTRGNEFWI
jgi:hypothetical protein